MSYSKITILCLVLGAICGSVLYRIHNSKTISIEKNRKIVSIIEPVKSSFLILPHQQKHNRLVKPFNLDFIALDTLSFSNQDLGDLSYDNGSNTLESDIKILTQVEKLVEKQIHKNSVKGKYGLFSQELDYHHDVSGFTKENISSMKKFGVICKHGMMLSKMIVINIDSLKLIQTMGTSSFYTEDVHLQIALKVDSTESGKILKGYILKIYTKNYCFEYKSGKCKTRNYEYTGSKSGFKFSERKYNEQLDAKNALAGIELLLN